MCVPITDKRADRVLGCLQLINKMDRYGEFRGSYFSDDDKGLARSCASIVAVVIMAMRARTAREERADAMISTQ
jgi:hypothetical protein